MIKSIFCILGLSLLLSLTAFAEEGDEREAKEGASQIPFNQPDYSRSRYSGGYVHDEARPVGFECERFAGQFQYTYQPNGPQTISGDAR